MRGVCITRSWSSWSFDTEHSTSSLALSSPIPFIPQKQPPFPHLLNQLHINIIFRHPICLRIDLGIITKLFEEILLLLSQLVDFVHDLFGRCSNYMS